MINPNTEAERRYNCQAVCGMICRQVGVEFSWKNYSAHTIPGLGCPDVQIPMHRGHLLRFDRGQATDLMAATIPI